MNIHFIICIYLEKSFKHLKSFLNNSNKKAVTIVLNDVSLKKNLINIIGTEYEILIGKNEVFDFSSYVKGIENLNEKSLIPQVTYFINDSFFQKYDYNFNYNLFSKYNIIINSTEDPIILGYKSNYNSMLNSNPFSNAQFFIPTFCFAMNKKGIELLLEIYYNMLNSDFLMKNDLNIWKKKLDNKFINFINTHIFLTLNPLSWEGKFKYKLSHEDLFVKSRCVYLEHKLSGELYQKGQLLFINNSFKKDLLLKVRNRLSSFFK